MFIHWRCANPVICQSHVACSVHERHEDLTWASDNKVELLSALVLWTIVSYGYSSYVCYGEVVIYVIVNNKLLIAIVRPLKHTAQSTLEIDDEIKRHPVLRKFVQPKSERHKLATHIKLVDLNNKYRNLTAVPVVNVIKKYVYGDKQVEGYATISCFPYLTRIVAILYFTQHWNQHKDAIT